MKESTRAQIEAMKNQTIGVEVEMYGISRENAAKTAATFFGTGRYEYTAHRNGYQTWSAWDDRGREWKFQRDCSILADRDEEKCEMVTPILTYEDIEGLQELVRQLRHNKAKSDPSHMCGVHIHIGADETTITYPQFLKTMSNHIHSLGKQVVVWNPASGVAISKDAGIDMTQMWSTAGKAVSGIPNIDCRYNYINHFDLFADLVGIYKSNIYYADKGSEEIAGEITAVWNDRNLPSHEDIMRQNNVYASVLASAERAWKGGGKKYIEQGGTTLPNEGDEFEEFRDWETRFLFHKENSLKDEPISYVRQTDIVWNVTDAFPNGGNMNMQFPPETDGEKQSYTYNGKTYNVSKATGAGIYLRHTWGTTVPAFYDSPEINHTAYAWTYVYSQT